MINSIKKVRECNVGSREQFKAEIIPSFKPAVIRGYVRSWESVSKASESAKTLADYLSNFDLGKEIITYYGSPDIEGKMFYNENFEGFNFERKPETLTSAISNIVAELDNNYAPSIYSGSVDIQNNLPDFVSNNHCDLPGRTAQPRIWIGNAAVVSTHYDLLDNVVCSVAGKRRFLLFPPEQVKNLYVGPIDYTLSGQPVSMVDARNPDFEKFPKFKEALAHAEVAELEPGDALFIPKLWWHHVESFEKFNVIVNYWWDETALGSDTPYAGFLYAILTLRHLPEKERAAWKAFYDQYIFQTEGDSTETIPEGKRGILGKMSPSLYRQLKNQILSLLLKK